MIKILDKPYIGACSEFGSEVFPRHYFFDPTSKFLAQESMTSSASPNRYEIFKNLGIERNPFTIKTMKSTRSCANFATKYNHEPNAKTIADFYKSYF